MLKKYKKNGTFTLDLGNCTSSGEAWMKYLHHLFIGGSSTDLIHSTWTPVDHINAIGDSNFFVVYCMGPVSAWKTTF